MKKHIFIVLSLLASLAVSAGDDYTLVWNADFAQEGLDRNAFNIEVNGDGGGNNELQYYCEKAVSLGVEPTTGKHCLILTATKENYMGKTCTSGRVTTQKKVSFTYGKVEARILMPKTANGLWPAFWMLGENISEVGWPRCGETDIVELGNKHGIDNNTQERYFSGALHTGHPGGDWCEWHDTTYEYSVEDTFHIFTCEWTPTSVTMYVDKDSHPGVKPYFSAKLEPNEGDADYDRQLVWSKPCFVIFNLAVGGNFPQIWDINGITALQDGPRRMYIDWLRIYQRGDEGETFSAATESEPIEQGGTAITHTKAESARARKVLHNGQLLIEADGHHYNIIGQQVNMH